MNENLLVPPIKLLSGHHEDTGKTGAGCFMDVLAYINGEDVITDDSTCVCVTVGPIVRSFNDWLRGDEWPVESERERHLLLPYLLRAMGSRTMEKAELVRRADLCAAFAAKCSESAAESAESAERAARAASAAWAESAESAESAERAARAESAERAARAASAESAESAERAARAESAERAARAASAASAASAESAESAESAAYEAWRKDHITLTLNLLNDILPPLTPIQTIHAERIEKLKALVSA